MRRNFKPFLLGLALACGTWPAQGGAQPLKGEDPGRRLYLNKCAKCHKFYDPAKYSDAQWRGWMEKMSSKAKLTPAQEKLLEAYIERNLRATNQERKMTGKPE